MKNRCYRWSLGFIFTLFCIASQVHAKTPSDASVTELMKFVNIVKTESEFKEQFDTKFKPQIESLLPNLNAKQQSIADQMLLDTADLFAKNLNYKEIFQAGYDAIKKIFTQEEVDLLIQFYSSPEWQEFSKNIALGVVTPADIEVMGEYVAENFPAGFEQKTAELMAVIEEQMQLGMQPFMGDFEAIILKAKIAIEAAK